MATDERSPHSTQDDFRLLYAQLRRHNMLGSCETLRRIEEQFDASEKYAAEGWGWLNEALEALGAETVFDIALRKGRIEQLERENGRLALEAATADQDWKRAEAEADKLRHALTQVRAECDLPDYIAEFIGEVLSPSSPNVRKSWGPERMRHDPERLS